MAFRDLLSRTPQLRFDDLWLLHLSFGLCVAGFGPVYSGNWSQISVAIKVLEEAGGQGDQVAVPEGTEASNSVDT